MATDAFYTGLAGLQANALLLDVVGHNLANANTTAYKAQRVGFQDLVYQTLYPGSGPSATTGGINPQQLGFGVVAGSIQTLNQQGTLTPTGRGLDLALQGGGYFMVSKGGQTLYTRAGAFSVDTAGYLVDSTTGARVQRFGTVGETAGSLPGFQAAGDTGIRVPAGTGLPGQATANVTVAGNLSASMAVGDTFATAIQVFDTQGTVHTLDVTFTKSAANTFSVAATVSGGSVAATATTVTFNADGSLASPATLPLTLTLTGLTATQTVTLNLGTVGQTNGLTQFGGNSAAAAITQDGASAGSLVNVGVDQNGVVQGTFSNGQTLAMAQLALANFTNPEGLFRQGENYYAASTASGVANIGTANTGGRGSIQGGALESSNVDTAGELARLIIAQRGYQVNARTITVANQVGQEITNLIR